MTPLEILARMAEVAIAADQVLMLDSPWHGGRTINAYHGPVEACVRLPASPKRSREERLDRAIADLQLRVRRIAAVRGANAIVSLGLEVDPFGREIVIWASGSAFAVGLRDQPQSYQLPWPYAAYGGVAI